MALLPAVAAHDRLRRSDQRPEGAGRQQIADQLEDLEAAVGQLAEDYVAAIDEKDQLDAEVAAAEQKVAEQQAAVDASRRSSSEVAVAGYMGAGTDGVGPMFTARAGVTDEPGSATSCPGSP